MVAVLDGSDMMIRAAGGLLASILAALAGPAEAGFFDGGDPVGTPPGPAAGETISIEPSFGYLRGTSTEFVNNYGNTQRRVSRLDWDVSAATAGARVAVRPIEGLTIRGRFWAAVAAGAEMRDYDWLGGYYGNSSWTHRSISPKSEVPKAWQGDVSVAVNLIEAEDVTLAGLAGFRHYNIKHRATGGSFVYSVNAFRDTVGTLPGDQLGVSYEQWWSTPYIGIGAYYRGDDLALGAELIGSPLVMVEAKDYHNLRKTLFKENYPYGNMVGVSVSAEYRLSDMFWLVGRFEYQHYAEAHGRTRAYDGAANTLSVYPKPAAGASADTFQVTAGVKAKI